MISVEHLSKRYVLRHQQRERYTALRDVLANKAKGLFRQRSSVGGTEEFLALNDVSFTVEPGDRLGIIGRNGAGKSTLLKVLSRIVEPTKGRITIDGRVASLLEVGTGFHPELTGRENIFLNGAILGMSRAEITAKFDEIVAFAEVERFLDTPVKRYSSGMYVRLAFAVAAHLEPEILIVDEVLAVGDAAFQRKCLGKMEEVSGAGRTVLFVSHQMDAVQRLCNKGLLLDKGRVLRTGSIGEVLNEYLSNRAGSLSTFTFRAPHIPGLAHAEQLRVEGTDGEVRTEVAMGADWQVRITVQVHRPIEGFVVGLGISSLLGLPIRTTWSHATDVIPGRYDLLFRSDGIHLAGGSYKLVVGLSHQGRVIQYLPDEATLEVAEMSELVNDPRILNTKSGLLLNQMPVEIRRLS
ncbi:MAG: ABC transporter ATP-binding protein [Flavobacteriales bacterium]|nr:ABC transporter ATP-binding protein [Flavobacteriales bacterium]